MTIKAKSAEAGDAKPNRASESPAGSLAGSGPTGDLPRIAGLPNQMMKKNTLLILLLCAIPAAVLRPATTARRARQGFSGGEGGPSKEVGLAATGIAYLMPQVDNDFSDLDVRDAQNRPVQAPQAKQQLEELFRESLINLTVFAAPHIVSQTEDWLNQFSHLFNKSIFARLVVVVGLFQDAFLPPNRRFVHNVHNLCTTLFVGIFLTFSLLSIRPTSTSACRLILRC